MKAKFLSEKEYKKKKKEFDKTFEKEEDLEDLEQLILNKFDNDGTLIFQDLYNNIRNILKFYMDLPDDIENIVTLWIIGTHFHDNFETYPYLFINAMRGSGKTRLLKIISCLARNGTWTSNLTESVMFRTSGTLCLDEFEGVGSKEKTALRELLNSGYKKGMKIFRMAKKKTPDGETQAVEEFESYRPVAMANIWGMEEILGDRCISLTLEKSMDISKTKLIENFQKATYTTYTTKTTNLLVKCHQCRYVGKNNIPQNWNFFVKQRHTLPTSITLPTLPTLPTLNTYMDDLTDEEIKDFTLLFDKIDKTEIEGRFLELFLPLFLVAKEIGDETLDKTIQYAMKMSKEKKVEDVAESKDVLLYSIVAKEDPNNWKNVKDLTEIMRLMIGEQVDWLNSNWMTHALKRLNLVVDKRRTSKGSQVMLNVEKAKKKEAMFKPKDERENTKERED